MSKIMFGLITGQSVGDREVTDRLFELLDDPLIGPAAYDSIEDAKKPFARNAAADAAGIYRRDLILFVRGQRAGFVAMFQDLPTGWAQWTFWIDRSALTSRREDWLGWVFHVCEDLPILFGYGCLEDEFDAKHEDIEVFEDGTSAEGAVGVSAEELERYLPGVYWLTIFGPELTGYFRDKLQSVERATVEQLEGGQAALLLDEPVEPESMDERLETERKIAEQLGADHFFDRTRSEGYSQVPALTERLATLRAR